MTYKRHKVLVNLRIIFSMKSIILIILLVVCAESDGLQCLFTKGEDLSLGPLNKFNIIAFLYKIKQLPIMTYNDTNLCAIILYAEFSPTPDAGIRLTNSLKQLYILSSHSQVIIDTSMANFGDDDLTVSHVLTYACSYDECDREFLYKFNRTIDWLFNAHYTNLTKKLAEFIVADKRISSEKGN